MLNDGLVLAVPACQYITTYLRSAQVDKSPRKEVVIAAGSHQTTDVSGMRGGVPYVQGLIQAEAPPDLTCVTHAYHERL